MYVCVCLCAGLKPGQRKVLFTCLKRNDKREVKVAQLAGSVAEMSAYHHGEVCACPCGSVCFEVLICPQSNVKSIFILILSHEIQLSYLFTLNTFGLDICSDKILIVFLIQGALAQNYVCFVKPALH